MTEIGKFKRSGFFRMCLTFITLLGFWAGIKTIFRRLIKGHWSIYIDQIATSVSVTTTLAAMTGSPYSPLVSGRLRQVILTASGDAATALIEGVRVVLSSTSFAGVNVECMIAGAGIRTAPAFPIPVTIVDCDLPVATGVQITAQVQNQTGDTPVTPRYAVWGVFEG